MSGDHRCDSSELTTGGRCEHLSRKKKSKKITLRQAIVSRQKIQARYDAAQRSELDRKHWALADDLSANASGSPEVRAILRNRARYEVANNSYARGMLLTLANDMVGNGARIQIRGDNSELNNRVENEFLEWCDRIDLAEKMRTMRIATAQDGEVFAVITNGDGNELDLVLIEAEMVCGEKVFNTDPLNVDGIKLDKNGRPETYRVLQQHPGDGAMASDKDRIINAENMVHIFRRDRPGQARGIPEILPALGLFAQLRRYTLAVLSAAETAAYMAMVLSTDAPPAGADYLDPLDAIELERNMMTTLPMGWKAEQFKAEQPTTTYREFKAEILNEIARCLNMPFNVAAGNSSGYNYASGRLDHQVYFRAISIERGRYEKLVLDKLFGIWVREWELENSITLPTKKHTWMWDGFAHVDPAKEASAQQTRLTNRTTTLADEYAKQGQDWEEQLKQIAKEQALMDSLGIARVVPQGTKQEDQKESENE